MQKKRTDRLNSLLREVITEVIRLEVKNPSVSELSSVSRVDITPDLHYAKVFMSVIGTEQVKKATIDALQSAAGFIAVKASKKVVMRYFPELTFLIDHGVENQMRIEELLHEIKLEENHRLQNHNGESHEDEEQ